MATTLTETNLQLQKGLLLQRFPSIVAVRLSGSHKSHPGLKTGYGKTLLPQIRFSSLRSLTWCCPNFIIHIIIEPMFSFVNLKAVRIGWGGANGIGVQQ